MCSEDYLPWIVDLTLAHSPRLRGHKNLVSQTVFRFSSLHLVDDWCCYSYSYSYSYTTLIHDIATVKGSATSIQS